MKEQTPTVQSAIFALPVLLVLGLYHLGGDLSGPEQTYLARAARSIADLSTSLFSPLYLMLLKGWSRWIESPFWLRLPNLVAAMAALLLSNRVMRSSGGAHATPGALLLLAAAPFLVAQVQTLSPAVLALLASMAALVCFVDYLRTGSLSWLGLWVVATVLSWGVHAGLAYLLFVKWIYMLAYRERFRNRQLFWWIAQIPVTGFFIAVFGAGARPLASRLFSMPTDASIDWTLLFAQVATGVPRPAGLIGGVLLAVLLICGIWASRDWRRDTRHGLLLLGVFTPGILFLSPIGHPSFGLATLPFFCTLVSMGMRMFPRWARQALWAAVALTYLYGYWYIFD